MGEVLAHLRDVIPENAIVTNGAGNFAIWPNKFLKFGPKDGSLHHRVVQWGTVYQPHCC